MHKFTHSWGQLFSSSHLFHIFFLICVSVSCCGTRLCSLLADIQFALAILQPSYDLSQALGLNLPRGAKALSDQTSLLLRDLKPNLRQMVKKKKINECSYVFIKIVTCILNATRRNIRIELICNSIYSSKQTAVKIFEANQVTCIHVLTTNMLTGEEYRDMTPLGSCCTFTIQSQAGTGRWPI